MSQTPSNRRREGRNAFYRGGKPHDHQPYHLGCGGKAADWLEGWDSAKREDDCAIEREQEAVLADIEKVQEFARLYNLAKEQGLIS